jgi:hypothetical protein
VAIVLERCHASGVDVTVNCCKAAAFPSAARLGHGNGIAEARAQSLPDPVHLEEEPVKKVVLALAVAVATVAVTHAQTAAKPAASKPAAQTKPAPAKPAAAKPEVMKVEVVSTDAAAKTITVKDASGSSTTLTATGPAVAALAKVKGGDWVVVTRSDMNATKIVKAKATAAKPKK